MSEEQAAQKSAQKPKRGQLLGATLLLLLVTAVWGGGFVFTKNTLEQLPPLTFIFLRFFLGGLVCGALLLRKFSLLNRDILKKGLLTGIPLCLGYVAQAIGLQYTGVGNSAFITGVYVVFVPFFGWVFTRSLKMRQLGLGILAMFGLAVFSLQGDFSMNPGDLWTLAGALAYALHFVLLGRYTRGIDSLLLTFLQIVSATALAGILALLLEPPLSSAVFEREIWVSLLYCGVLATALCFFGQTAAQKLLSPTQASLIFTTEALFGAFFGWLCLNEIFSPRQFIGAFILIACIVVALLWEQE